jgi:hypothetical protein
MTIMLRALSRDSARMSPMLTGILSVSGVLAGGTIAYLARRNPRHRDLLETLAGILLIAGFGILGFSLGLVLCGSCSAGIDSAPF